MREGSGSAEMSDEEMQKQLKERKERKLADIKEKLERNFEVNMKDLESRLLSMSNDDLIESVMSEDLSEEGWDYNNEYSNRVFSSREEAKLYEKWDDEDRKMKREIYAKVLGSRLKQDWVKP